MRQAERLLNGQILQIFPRTLLLFALGRSHDGSVSPHHTSHGCGKQHAGQLSRKPSRAAGLPVRDDQAIL